MNDSSIEFLFRMSHESFRLQVSNAEIRMTDPNADRVRPDIREMDKRACELIPAEINLAFPVIIEIFISKLKSNGREIKFSIFSFFKAFYALTRRTDRNVALVQLITAEMVKPA